MSFNPIARAGVALVWLLICSPALAGERLGSELSPYLRSHSGDPVDWQPWGPDAFERARRESKLVVLSVGALGTRVRAAEELAFRDPEIVALLNSRFVCIKVDAEERPELAEIYGSAIELMASEPSGSPALPFVAVLTAEARPAAGRRLLRADAAVPVAAVAWLLSTAATEHEQRRGGLETRAGATTAALREAQSLTPARGALDPAVPERALRGLKEALDARHGGFGLPPKRAPHAALRFLLAEHRRTGSAEALRLATVTLEGMASGGLWDRSDGGFFREALDAAWRQPFAEKALGDNALLLRAYAEANEATGRAALREVAEAIAGWARSMRDRDGGFETARASAVPSPRRGEGQSGGTDGWMRDERVFAGANGLMIGALATSGALLDRPDDLDEARRAAAAVLARLGPAASLKRCALGARTCGPALLEDYAYLAEGLLCLHDATAEPRWRAEAVALAEVALRRFLDGSEGGFFDTDDEHGPLLARTRTGYEGGWLSPNGVMASILLGLGRATGEGRYWELGRRTIDAFLGDLQQAPRGVFTLAAAACAVLGDAAARADLMPRGRDTSNASGPLSNARVGPVQVRAMLSREHIEPGERLELRVEVTLAPGWHIAAHVSKAADLAALAVSVPGSLVDVSPPRYPAGTPLARANGSEPLLAHTGAVEVLVPLRVRAGVASGPASLRLRVGWQACELRGCRAPENALLELPLEVSARSR